MLRSPLVPICLAFLLGLLLAPLRPVPLVWSSGLALVGVGMAVVGRRRPRLAQWSLLLAVTLVGMARWTLGEHQPPHQLATWTAETPRVVRVQGIVTSDPVETMTSFGEPMTTALLDVQALRDDGTWQPTTGRLRITWMQPTQSLAYGDALLIEGALTRPRTPGNPGTFDLATSWARQGVHARLRVRPHDGVALLRRGQGHVLHATAYRLRRMARQCLQRVLPPEHGQLLAALLLGDRTGLSPELEEALVLTGTMHIMAISGFNVGILACALLWLLRMLWVPRCWRLLLTMACLGLFMLMTESRAPVVRATVMAWVVLGGMLLHRESTIYNSLALAALLLLGWNPRQLGDAGFQLSFAAVVALVTLTPRLTSACQSTACGQWLLQRRWGGACARLGLVSCAAWLGVTPLVLHHFGVLTPVAVLANMVVVPLMSGLLLLGALLVVVTSLSALVGAWCGWLVSHCAHLALVTVHAWAHVPWGGWYVAPLPWWGVMLLYGCGCLVWFRRQLKLPEARVAMVWLLVVNVWVWGRALTPPSQELRMTALDVGHGDAILLEFPQRGRLLIDGGMSDQGRWTIAPFLRARGIRRLDAVVLTHPDGDHVGGLATVLQSFDVGAVVENGDEKSTAGFQRYRALVEAKHIPRLVVNRGDRLVGFPDVTLDVLHPGPRDQLPANDRSLILRVRHGARTFLLCGDADETGLAALLRADAALRADVLKVPHHGSDLGRITHPFITQVEPSIAVISMVEHSAQALPHPTVLKALDRFGVECYLTGRDGATTIRSDGRELRVTAYRHPPAPAQATRVE